MNESNLMQLIRLELGAMPGVLLWRNSIGFDARAKVHYGICNPGGSDLIGAYNGRLLCIEVKIPGGLRSPAQINFIRIVRLHGGLAGFAESVQDARDIVAGLK